MTRTPDRFAAGFVVVDRSDAIVGPRVLLLRDAGHATWNVPKGHLEDGEPWLTGAWRELEEETGLTLADGVHVQNFRHRSQYEIRPGAYGPKKGPPRPLLKQVDLGLLILDDPAAIARFRISPEHDASIWATPAEALDLLHGFPDIWAAIDAALQAVGDG